MRVLLTANIDCSDRLTNDQLGYIHYFAVNKGTLAKLYIKYNDEKPDLRATQNEKLAKVRNATPLARIEAPFRLPKSHTCLI